MIIQTEVVEACPLCDSKSASVKVETKDYGFFTCENNFTFMECADCSGLYLRNRPLLSQLDQIYPNEYTAFNPSNKSSLVQKARDSVQLKKYHYLRPHIQPDDAILEFGCGAGELLQAIKRAKGQSHKLVGIDFSDVAAKDLRENGIEFWNGDLLDYEGSSGAFGAVILNQVIEHVAFPTKVVGKINKLLRPGGVVYMETPALGAWDAKLLPLKYWGGWHAPRHFFVFSADTLSRVLREQGFEVIAVSYIFSPFLWANSIQFYLEQEWGQKKLAKFFRISCFPYLCLIGVVELLQLCLTGRTSNLRVLARKVRDV